MSWRAVLFPLLARRVPYPTFSDFPTAVRLGALFSSDDDYPHASRFAASAQNPRVKLAKSLARRRGRDKSGMVLLEGHRLCCDTIEAALGASGQAQHLALPDTVFIGPSAFEAPEGSRLKCLLEQLPSTTVLSVSEKVLLSVATTDTPQAVCAILPRPKLPWDANADFTLVLDGIKDPGNMGTLVRSACAAGAKGILLVGECTDPWSPKAIRSAMGATFSLPIVAVADWEAATALGSGYLPQGDITVYAADAAGKLPYYDAKFIHGRTAVVIGSEATGLSTSVRRAAKSGAVRLISIPHATGPHMESLNAAVAGSVVMFEAQRQKKADYANK